MRCLLFFGLMMNDRPVSDANRILVAQQIKALQRGGVDEPGNMQWQTTAAAKAKDRIE
jgi:hypothetical protein